MSLEWMVIRGSGIAAFVALAAATIWGLLVSSKVMRRLVKAKPLTWFHESLGIVALLATAVHIVVLSIHDYLEFTWTEILVPGASDWGRTAVSLGIVSMYGLVVVVGTFYVKKHIGQKAWRTIHFLSLGVFVSALIHGVLAGTDSASPWLRGVYLGSALLVGVLLAVRLGREDIGSGKPPTTVPFRSSGAGRTH